MFYLETSALTGSNVERAFMTVIKEMYDEVKKKAITPAGNTPPNNKNNRVIVTPNQFRDAEKKKKKSCC